MPTRTAFVFTIGDVIESGPPNVIPSNRRNSSAPNSSSGENVGGMHANYKRSVSASSKINGRVGGAARGRPNGHFKQTSNLTLAINGKKYNETTHDSDNEEYDDTSCNLTSKNICESDSENSNDSNSLIFSTSKGPRGKNNGNKMARMKTRHISTSSTASLVNGNSQPSPVALAQAAKNASNTKPKKSIMKSLRLSQEEDEEVSFR